MLFLGIYLYDGCFYKPGHRNDDQCVRQARGRTMLNLNIAICDDDEIYRKNIATCLDSYLIAQDNNFTYTEFSSGSDLLKKFQQQGDFHIVFLDVEMPGTDGLKTAEIIKTTVDRHVFIVFISNYPDYMQDSFRVHPYYYLVKPISLEKVYGIMNEIVHEINDQFLLYTLIREDETEKTVNIRDIRYIDVSDGKKGILCFHFFDEKIETKGKLNDWAEKLANYQFLPCYRGILLNLAFIHYFHKHSAILDNGETVPISRGYEKKLQHVFLNNIVEMKKL